MAVEAPHMALCSPQTLILRDMIDQVNGSRYDDRIQTAYGMVPLPGTKTVKVPPMYGSGMAESFPTHTLKTESGLTCSLPLSRKRSRESASFNTRFSVPTGPIVNQNQLDSHQIGGAFAFLSEDISSLIHQQQLEIDRLIAHHTEKVRKDIEETRRRISKRLMAEAEEGIQKRLKAKEDEIMKIGQLNWCLEEKVKSVTVEIQTWRELAQTNEATANALRINLQQVLAQAHVQQPHHIDFADNAGAEERKTALMYDAQSHCGSNHEQDEDFQSQRERKVNQNNDEASSSRYGGVNRLCRNCGREEACVLLLPCRHMCVCTVCASVIGNCPVCKSYKSAALNVIIT